jgi:CubicO group peptidase (beta-lactamase class C family)
MDRATGVARVPAIDGEVAPGFERIRDAFADNFARAGEFAELGAGLAVFVHGERVVRLAGGYCDPHATRLWKDATLVNVWSASKVLAAVAIAQLVDAGRLDYMDPVADCWPEFAVEGKSAITIEQLLCHQAGLNGFSEPTTPEDLFDWDLTTARLACQRPFWTPGTLTSYHAMTFGWLAGEVVRRVSGLEFRDYVRQRIAEPLGADLWIGCPERRRADVATIVAPQPDRALVELNAIAQRAVSNPTPDAARANTDARRSATSRPPR